MNPKELIRIRDEYGRRARDARYSDWYAACNPANVFSSEERERGIARLLTKHTDMNLSAYRILDVGCGLGHELAKFTSYGTTPSGLLGLDLLLDRIRDAKTRFPDLSFICGNAGALCYPEQTFDLVLQFTVFTSILDDVLRQQMASEMLRVLKPGGLILWYDFRWNPMNRQTRGIGMREIEQLFPQCLHDCYRQTLAPPLARLVAPYASLYSTLDRIPFLKSHYLVAIRRSQHEAAL